MIKSTQNNLMFRKFFSLKRKVANVINSNQNINVR